MNIKQAKEQIKNAMTAYFTKDETGDYMMPAHQQRPVFLMGPPGIGKTAIMEQIASEMGVALLSYSMTHHTRQSALGLPFIVHKTYQDGKIECDISQYTMSEIIAAIYDMMEETGLREGILFLDEINCVSETLSPIMLQFLQYKVFGRYRVPEGWIVVTAGNPPEYNNSVREFDLVTWDRLKRIDVEPDFQVWKEYAVSVGVHPSITSYLEIKPDHFYRVQTRVEGKAFVTARGWEDLSRMIRLYERNKIAVNKLLIIQYLQDDKIAADFAQYYALFCKYRSDYQIRDILAGTADNDIYSRAEKAAFDERLALIGLILDALRASAQTVMDEVDVMQRLMPIVRSLAASRPTSEGVRALADKSRDDLEKGKKSSSISATEQRALKKLIQALSQIAETLTGKDGAEAVQALKKNYTARTDGLQKSVKDMGRMLTNVFAFAESVFGDGQEMLITVTEMTACREIAAFIAKFGCKEYFRHNRDLLLHERQIDIERELRELNL